MLPLSKFFLLSHLCKWDSFLLFCIAFEHMAGGIGSPVKAALVYCFHELNKAQKENQKIDFSLQARRERKDSVWFTYECCLIALLKKIFSNSVLSSLRSYILPFLPLIFVVYILVFFAFFFFFNWEQNLTHSTVKFHFVLNSFLH